MRKIPVVAVLSLALLAIVFGQVAAEPVAPALGAEPVPVAASGERPSPTGPGRLLPDVATVEQRLVVYRERLARWNQLLAQPFLAPADEAAWRERLTGCREQATRILSGYEGLKKILAAATVIDGANPSAWEIVFADIHYLESGCLAGPEAAGPPPAGDGQKGAARTAEAAIPTLFREDNYPAVVATFEKAMTDNAQWQPGPDLRKAYGLALVKLGRYEEAAPVLKGIVEVLLADHDFKQAIELLDQLLAGPLSEETRAVLLRTREEAGLAETKEMEYRRQAGEQTQALAWTEAVNLLDLRHYDEAIAAFTALLGTPYEEEAKARIALAINQAANDNRRQAAALFVKARKTQDPKYRRELLLESRQLLVDVLQKYPGAEINDKIKQNLMIIEEQLRTFE